MHTFQVVNEDAGGAYHPVPCKINQFFTYSASTLRRILSSTIHQYPTRTCVVCVYHYSAPPSSLAVFLPSSRLHVLIIPGPSCLPSANFLSILNPRLTLGFPQPNFLPGILPPLSITDGLLDLVGYQSCQRELVVFFPSLLWSQKRSGVEWGWHGPVCGTLGLEMYREVCGSQGMEGSEM